MNGQLADNPLPELIREILEKKLSGKLRVQRERIKLLIYFEKGRLLYAVGNLRGLRLAEYLRKGDLLSEGVLERFSDRISDISLAKALCDENLVPADTVAELQAKQVTDTLKLGLLWTDGTWEFDYRSHLNENVDLAIDIRELMLEAGRRFSSQLIASRLRNPVEVFTPEAVSDRFPLLSPNEAFIFSRIEEPAQLNDIVAGSAMPETDVLQIIYSLALAGVVKRGQWKSAFRSDSTTAPPEKKTAASSSSTPAVEESLETYLERIAKAATLYEVLGIANDTEPIELKAAYYRVARNWHPDRFRSDRETHAKVESAFTRVTQAYDTLRDPGLRATYDSKIDARLRASEQSPNITAPAPSGSATSGPEQLLTNTQRAERDFNEALAALETGQKNAAMSLFASAARLVPTNARFRAHYGYVLSANSNTRRLAEAELLSAIKLEPNNPDYRVMLAELYRALGFTVRARGEVERALAAAPNHRKAQELLKTL